MNFEELNKALNRFHERRELIKKELRDIEKEEKTLISSQFDAEIGELKGKYLYIEDFGVYHLYMYVKDVQMAYEPNSYWSVNLDGIGVMRTTTLKDFSTEFKSQIKRKFYFVDEKDIKQIKEKFKFIDKETFIDTYQKYIDSCQKTLDSIKEE